MRSSRRGGAARRRARTAPGHADRHGDRDHDRRGRQLRQRHGRRPRGGRRASPAQASRRARSPARACSSVSTPSTRIVAPGALGLRGDGMDDLGDLGVRAVLHERQVELDDLGLRAGYIIASVSASVPTSSSATATPIARMSATCAEQRPGALRERALGHLDADGHLGAGARVQIAQLERQEAGGVGLDVEEEDARRAHAGLERGAQRVALAEPVELVQAAGGTRGREQAVGQFPGRCRAARARAPPSRSRARSRVRRPAGSRPRRRPQRGCRQVRCAPSRVSSPERRAAVRLRRRASRFRSARAWRRTVRTAERRFPAWRFSPQSAERRIGAGSRGLKTDRSGQFSHRSARARHPIGRRVSPRRPAGDQGVRCRAARPRTSRAARAPASSASRSTPVSTPISCSIETRSSVAMLPVAPAGTGQPPSSPKRGLEARAAGLQRREHVRQALTARVVEVAGQLRVAREPISRGAGRSRRT